MGLRIQNNIEAFDTHRQLQISSAAASSSMEKLSSGFRINRAADDAAGLAISEQMRGQIGGLDQAQRNAQDGVSLVQTGEGALNEVHSMLDRLRDLKVQFNNQTLNDDDRNAIAAEAQQIGKELSDVTTQTKFNGNKLLDGSTFTFQVGANDNETISTDKVDLTAALSDGGLAAVTSLSSGAVSDAAAVLSSGALSDIQALDDAIKNVSTARASFGAIENRLNHRLNNLATYQENLTASESRIRDVDMAAEMTNYTKQNILQQAGTSMLAQANQAPQNVLSLLRG
jgi:flagellin